MFRTGLTEIKHMHCQFVTGIIEIELDISYFNITARTSTKINKARVNYKQPDIATKTGTNEIEIGIVKYRKASAATVENGTDVSQKGRENSQRRVMCVYYNRLNT
jgi:hypothetical protein